MDTRIIKVNTRQPDKGTLSCIADTLNKNGIIAYPTDTFYGLGACAVSVEAVKKIYLLKDRDSRKPVSVVIADLEDLRELVTSIPPVFYPLSSEFWPGPLTMIFHASPVLPRVMLGEKNTIGIRLPGFEWLRSLIRRAGCPITATSANLAGERELSVPADVADVFLGKIEMIVDAGESPGGLPSTVIDLTQEKPLILREGALSSARLTPFIGKI